MKENSSNDPLLITKLNIPGARPNLISRAHLLARLSMELWASQDPQEAPGFQRKLTLVSAPAGFGKTTLVTTWLARLECPYTWLSLDEMDNDFVRFTTYLATALGKVDPGISHAMLGALQVPGHIPPETLVRILINAIAATPEPFTLVLDDYQVIINPIINDFLRSTLEYLPPQCHLVVISRSDPPLPLSRLRVRGEMEEIRAADLRFTTQEINALFNQVMGLSLTGEQVRALESRTEGWIAGLQLAALSMQTRDDVAGFIQAFSGSHRYVIDYLAEEVLQQQNSDLRGFLLQTAILDRLTPPLCDAVTGREDSKALLTELEHANLFLVSLDDRREWYRYHHLFADFLLSQSAASDLLPLHHKAARWYESKGFMEQAVKHVLAIGDVDEAGQVIARAGEKAIQNGQFSTLQSWLNALPEKTVRAHCALSSLKASVLLMIREFKAAETYLDVAEDNLPAEGAIAKRGTLTYLRACLALARGDIPSTIELCLDTLELIKDKDPVRRCSTLHILGETNWLLDDLETAARYYREAYGLRHVIGTHFTVMSSLGGLALLLLMLGQRREAMALCQDALDQCSDIDGKPLPIAGVPHIALGILYYEGNQLDQASQHLHIGLGLCKQFSVTGIYPRGLTCLALLQRAMGETESALRTIREARQMTSIQPSRSPIDPILAATEANIQLKSGNLAEAAGWAKRTKLSPKIPPGPVQDSVYLTYASLLLAQNHPRDALTLLNDLEKHATRGGRTRSLISIHILHALAHEALDQTKAAREHITQALQLAAPEGYSRAFLDEGQLIAELLPKVHHITPAFVDKIIDGLQKQESKSSISPPEISPPAPKLIEPLTRRELQVIQLIAAGYSNQEIADELVIALSTVKRHISNIYGKTGVKSRTQAVLQATELGLIH